MVQLSKAVRHKINLKNFIPKSVFTWTVKLLSTNAGALPNLGLCWFCFSLITFPSNFLFVLFIFLRGMFQNTSNVPIWVETGSDNATINESERNVKQNL